MPVPPLLIPGPDDPNGLVKAGELPVTGKLPVSYRYLTTNIYYR